MEFTIKPIGYVKTDIEKPPRHWTVSDITGRIVIDKKYEKGLMDIKAGQKIVILFHFHKSPLFNESFLRRKPPHHKEIRGVFSTCSPVRPNPVGLSVLDVLDRKDNVLYVKGIDMFNNTPVIDIKPHTEEGYEGAE